MSTEEQDYEVWLRYRQECWEARCGRCGACCGAFDGDACEHLRKDEFQKYDCAIYENRFGKHRTLHGHEIHCVPIRQILHSFWPGDACCGYKMKYEQ